MPFLGAEPRSEVMSLLIGQGGTPSFPGRSQSSEVRKPPLTSVVERTWAMALMARSSESWAGEALVRPQNGRRSEARVLLALCGFKM